LKEVTERREKRREIAFATMKVKEKEEQFNKDFAEQGKKLADLEQKMDSFELSVKQM